MEGEKEEEKEGERIVRGQEWGKEGERGGRGEKGEEADREQKPTGYGPIDSTSVTSRIKVLMPGYACSSRAASAGLRTPAKTVYVPSAWMAAAASSPMPLEAPVMTTVPELCTVKTG